MSRGSCPNLSEQFTAQDEGSDVVIVRQAGCAHSTDDTRQHRGGRTGSSDRRDTDDPRDALVDVFTAAFDQTVGDDDKRTTGLQLDVDDRSILRLYAEGKPAVACH